MKNLDMFSKRFLVITLGISSLLLSGSLFLLALNSVTTASAKDKPVIENISDLSAHLNKATYLVPVQDDLQDEDIKAIQAFGIGIREGNLYFGILYNNNTIGLHRSSADGEDVLDW
jgi:hypothetical protein